MSKTSISQFSTSAASNTDINGINVNTGWPPSNVGPAFRTLMALLADVCQGAQSWTTVVTTAGIKTSGTDAGSFALRATNGNYGVGIQNNGSTAFLIQTASGDADGGPNSYRPFSWDLASGAVTVDGTGRGAAFGGAASFAGLDSGGFGIRFKFGNYGAGLLNSGTDTYLLLTNSGDQNGAANSLRPLTVHNATGAVTVDGTGAGTTFGGGVTVQNALSVVTGGQGGAGLVVGSGGNPGFLSITNSSGTQVGVVGFTDGSAHILLQAQNGYTGYRCTGTFTVDGLTNFVGGNGNPIGTQTSGWSFVSGGAAAGYAASGAPLALGNGVLGGNILNLFFGNSQTGSVANNGAGTGVVYNTTSDENLKLDDGLIDPAEARRIVMGLKPRWFRWRADPDAAPEPGFFAQQVHRVFRWAVTKGKGKPGSKNYVPWQMDHSKFAPVIIALLQDQERRLAAQEARK